MLWLSRLGLASEKTAGARGTAVAAAVSVGSLRRTWLRIVRCHFELGLLGHRGQGQCLGSRFRSWLRLLFGAKVVGATVASTSPGTGFGLKV